MKRLADLLPIVEHSHIQAEFLKSMFYVWERITTDPKIYVPTNDHKPDIADIDIIPEYKVGKYRADFLIGLRTVQLLVECDGHDWHSSKEQISKDNERTRWLNRRGWEIYRFTGRDINDNSIRCATEVIRWMLMSYIYQGICALEHAIDDFVHTLERVKASVPIRYRNGIDARINTWRNIPVDEWKYKYSKVVSNGYKIRTQSIHHKFDPVSFEERAEHTLEKLASHYYDMEILYCEISNTDVIEKMIDIHYHKWQPLP